MRFVGIDPGLHITGYACLDLDDRGDTTVVEAGVVRMPSRAPMSSRLGQLHGDLSQLFGERRPGVVAIEKLFAHARHVRTSILMAHARGVVLLAAEQCGARIEEYNATEVKKAIAGNGHASKHQMQLAVMSQCRLPELPQPPDVADAMGIALCAAHRAVTRGVLA